MWPESIAPTRRRLDSATPVRPRVSARTSSCNPTKRDETRAETFLDIAVDPRTGGVPAGGTGSLWHYQSSSDQIQSRTHPPCDNKPGSNPHVFHCPTTALVRSDVRPKTGDAG